MSERNVPIVLFLLCFLAFAEFLSWGTTSWPGQCLIQEAHGDGRCPVLHEGLGILIGRFGEFAKRTAEFIEDHDKGIVALFTVILAISTIGLWLATVRLYIGGEQQFTLARDDFNSSHRPEIRVKHVVLASDVWQGDPIIVDLWCVNTGSSDAFLNEVGIRYHVVKNDRVLPFDPRIAAIPIFSRGWLLTGRNLTLPNINVPNFNDGRVLDPTENGDIQEGRAKLYCVGYLSYFDRIGRMRITGFCRVLEFPPGTTARVDNSRFRTHLDPDYEYQD